MKKNTKNFIKNISSLGIVQSINYIGPLITLPYLYNTLGTSNFGIIAYSNAFTQYFLVFSIFGTNLYLPGIISKKKRTSDYLNLIINSVLIGKIILLIFSTLIIVALSKLSYQIATNLDVIFYSFLFVIIQALQPNWFFQGIEKMKWISNSSVISNIIFILLIFIFINDSSDYKLLPLVKAFSFSVGLIYSYSIILTKFNWSFKLPDISFIYKIFRKSYGVFLSRVSFSIYSNSNSFFIGSFISMEAAGIFSLIEKISIAFKGIFEPLNMVLYPMMTRSKNINKFKKIYSIGVIISIFLIILVQIFIDDIAVLFLTDWSNIHSKHLKVLIWGSFISINASMIGFPLLTAFGYLKETNLSMIYASLFHLIMLIGFYTFNIKSIAAVIILILATESIVLISRAFFVYKFKLW